MENDIPKINTCTNWHTHKDSLQKLDTQENSEIQIFNEQTNKNSPSPSKYPPPLGDGFFYFLKI